ncbi:MAG: hypothetical protein ACT4OM_03320 [Actinomycetota bacterium]
MLDRLTAYWATEFADAVPALAWQPSGERLAVGSLAGEVVVVSAEGDRQVEGSLEQEVLSIGWSADGAWLAAGGRQGRLDMWEQGMWRRTLHLGRWAGALAWASDRPLLAVAAGPDVYVVDSEGKVRAEYLLHPGYVNDVAWEPCGALMAASVGGISFYDPGQPGSQPVSFAPSTGSVIRLAQSPDGEMLAGGKSNGSVVVWKVEGGAGTVLTGSEGAVEHLSWSPDGRSLAVAALDELTIWRRQDEEIVSEGLARCPVVDGHPGGVRFHPWRDVLAWGGPDGEVAIWDINRIDAGKVADCSLEGRITGLAWHPFDDRLAVATSSGVLACLELG